MVSPEPRAAARGLAVVGMLALASACFSAPAYGGAADVVAATVRRVAPGVYDFDVTVRSVDRGSDYADAIEVLAPDGRRLGRRELLHSHEDEQPFTRDVHGVKVPAGVAAVVIRAHHRSRGYDGRTLTITLPR